MAGILGNIGYVLKNVISPQVPGIQTGANQPGRKNSN